VEYFDVLDPNGQPTGICKLREEVHRDGDWHRTVHAWILNSRGELLIQKRSMTKDSNPGLWDVSAAGHLSAGETPLEALVKEVREELGLDVPPGDFRYLFTVAQQALSQTGTFLDNEFQEVYLLCIDVPLEAFRVQPEEVSELRYVPLMELEQLILDAAPEFVTHDEEYRRLFEILAEE
jgi:isopentenyldiphosphate isomerase